MSLTIHVQLALEDAFLYSEGTWVLTPILAGDVSDETISRCSESLTMYIENGGDAAQAMKEAIVLFELRLLDEAHRREAIREFLEFKGKVAA